MVYECLDKPVNRELVVNKDTVKQNEIRIKRTRRGRKTKSFSCHLRVIGTNAAGVKAKLDSLEHVISQLKPGVIMLQETKLYRKGQVRIKDYETFELNRQSKEGGGLAIIAHQSLEPVLISEGDEEHEILTVEGNFENLAVRFITGYGPQESENVEKRNEFYLKIEEECQKAKLYNIGVIIELDSNAKLGPEYIKEDKHELSPNGKLV